MTMKTYMIFKIMEIHSLKEWVPLGFLFLTRFYFFKWQNLGKVVGFYTETN